MSYYEEKNIDVHILLEQTGESYFNGNGHLNHFLNYLFRTDKAQKNTDERTTENIAIYHKDKKLVIKELNGLDNRQILKGYAWKYIRLLANNDSDFLSNDIIYMVVEDLEQNNIEHLSDYEDKVAMIKLALKQRDDLSNCLFHVLHVDQETMHLHTVKIK